MGHKFIHEIAPGEAVEDVYMVNSPVLRSTTRGDLYIAMYLADRTGRLNARMWQASEAVYSSLPNPGFVRVQGRSELYRNNLQFVVNDIRVVDADSVRREDFLARTDKDTGRMFAEIREMTGAVRNPQLKALISEFLNDEALMEKFRAAPAAMKLHHSYLGGLLEHTYNTLRVARAILPLYSRVQADLVLTGLLLHDIGKIEELSYDMAFAYTDSGQLLGHIAQTLLMIHRKAEALAAKGARIDKEILDPLDHIILSHHGRYEFGSPKLPATAEAFMVNYIDDLDAKIDQVNSAIANEQSDSNWTAWQKQLETRLYRKRID